MASHFSKRIALIQRATTQRQLFKFIHGHNVARTALEHIEPVIIRASPIPARIYNEQRSRYFTAPNQARDDGAQALSSNPDDREKAAHNNSRVQAETNTQPTPLLRPQQVHPHENQPRVQPRMANAQIYSQRASSSLSQPSRQLRVPLTVAPSDHGMNVRTNLVQTAEQRPNTLQLARLQGIHPLGTRPQIQVGTQQVVLLRPTIRPQQALDSRVLTAQPQALNNVSWNLPAVSRSYEQRTNRQIVPLQWLHQLLARRSQPAAMATQPDHPGTFPMINVGGTHRVQAPLPEVHGSVSDLETLELRAARARLEVAQLELALIEKRLALHGRSHAATDARRHDERVHQELNTDHVQLLEIGPSRIPADVSSAPDLPNQNPQPAKRKSNNKGKNLNIYDGYAYKSEGPPKSNGTQYFSCIKKDGVKCKATGSVRMHPCLGRFIKYSDGRKKFTGNHSCIKIPLLDRRRDFHNALCMAAREESGLLKNIYDRIVPKYSDVAKYMMFQPNVRKNMYYHRHQVQRSWKCRVKDMKQLHEVLQTEDGKRCLLVLEDPDGIAPSVQFETVTVWVDNEPYIMYFDRRFLGKLEGADVLRVDATFASRMKIKGLRQFLTVMVQAYGKAFPGVFVNMPRKTKKGYVGIFEEIKKNPLKNFKIRQIITDFEEGEQNALKEVYGPDVTYTSCHFHWNQAIWKNALRFQVGFPRMSESEPGKFEVIRKIMALPLLPREFIYPTYLIIKADAQKKFGKFFTKFFGEYLEPYWFGKRGEDSFCVFGELFRTNNDEESYHRDLNSLFGHKRPAVKNAHHVLLRFIQRQFLVLEGMMEGMSRLPRNPISAFNEKLLLEEWQKVPKKLTPIHFVTIMANEMKRFLTMTEEDIEIDQDEDNEGNDGDESEGEVGRDGGDDRQNGAEEDENVDTDTVEGTHESSISDEDLGRLIQNLDESVILGNEIQSSNGRENKDASVHQGDLTDRIEPLNLASTSGVIGNRTQSIVNPTHQIEILDPAHLCEAAVDGTPSIAEPSSQMNTLHPVPSGPKVDAVESLKSSKLKKKPLKRAQRQPLTSKDKSTNLRSKRQPKPEHFDDFVVPAKRTRRS